VIKHIPISSTLPENKSGILYFGNFLYQNDREAVIQSEGKLYRTTFTNNTVKEHEITRFYTMSGLLYNDIIITHANDELIYLDTANFKELKRIPFKNTGGVRCFANPAPTTHGEVENDIYIGSNKGIFKIDPGGKILQHFSKKSGLADECIYAMAFDEEGFLWCSTNKGIIKINKDKSIQQLKKEDGLQENEFNTNAVARAEDGELFFGGVNGLNSFYPAAIKSFEEKINLFFTKIKVNNEDFTKDIAVWEIDKMNLSYNQNALAFDCIAMGSSNPGQYIYQYRMSGVDKEWIQSNELQTVRYYLQPGHYVLQVYASRVFDKEAKPLKEIDIIIQPPFWKTWWFLAIAISLFAGLLAILINEKNKKVFQQKLQSLENEKQLQGERERISKDLHDNLGAYANAVLFNTEQLEKEKEDHKKKLLIDDLKFASKDIITSLRETVWALKKETYSAEDCIVRVRNFIHPLSRYYSHINFKIDGEIPATLNLHYSMALNLVRIVQEAISNSIKHSKAKHISVTSYDLPEGWKLVIADDGMGFNFNNKIEAEEGNGLYNMHHRANESGFAMTIKTADKEGTLITLKL
ncbi:MAG: triple tyrosine motif-containing protein, partial [Ferruginibacter sp.]